jgi:hypothetical protein
MTTVIIAVAVVLLLVVLINLSVVIDISYIGGKLDYKVRYFIFKLFPLKKFSGKIKNKNKKNSISEAKEENNSKKKFRIGKKSGNTENLTEKIEDIMQIIECSVPCIKKTAQKIAVKNIYIDFISRNEDACICAVNYGIMNGIVYNALGLICSLFKTTFKSVSVGMHYNKSGNIYDFSFSLKLKLGTGIKTALSILFHYMGMMYNKKSDKLKE